MINKQELRLNNWVQYNGEYCKINSLTNHYSEIANKEDKFVITSHIALTPIPLTEDILLKCGFEKALNGWWDKDEIFSYRDGYFGFGTNRHTKIDYLHQLQNLYFALTGEELKINLW